MELSLVRITIDVGRYTNILRRPLERLLFKRFCNENGVINVKCILGENSADDFAIGAIALCYGSVIENQSFQDLQERYGQYKDNIRSGLLRKNQSVLAR